MKKTNALRILDQRKADYKLVEYRYDENHLSVQEITRLNDLPVERVFKTLVLKGDKTGILVALIPGHQQLHFKSLAKISGNKKVTTVSVKDLEGLTGYIRGGCSPIGMKKNFPVFMDQSALHHPGIYVNAGKKGLLFEIDAVLLQEITDGKIAVIASEGLS